METPNKKNILVTGGTGLLGAHVLQQLVGKGYNVKAICRTTSSKKVVEKVFGAYADAASDIEKITWLTGDVTDYFSLEEAMAGMDAVYHIAGFISFQGKDRKKLEDINIKGTANVVNAAMQCGVKKVIYVSSVAALGRADVENMITEETLWKNSPVNTHYAITKQAGEREVWRGSEEGLDVLVVNPGLVLGYGDWETGTGKIVKRIAEGQKFYTDGCNGWVDVRDVARAMIDLDEAGIVNEKYILISENVPFEKGFSLMAKHLGSKAPSVKAGKMMMKTAVWTERIVSFLFSKEPLVTPETIMTASLQSRYDNSKIKKAIGFEFIPFEETVKEVSRLYHQD